VIALAQFGRSVVVALGAAIGLIFRGSGWAEDVLLILAATAVPIQHYLFSFQRMTLHVARTISPEASLADLAFLQAFMAPGWMRSLCRATDLCAGLLGTMFGWPWAAGYLLVTHLIGVVAPLFQLRKHYVRLALKELEGPQELVAQWPYADLKNVLLWLLDNPGFKIR